MRNKTHTSLHLSRGFTLVEVLLALTLMSMLLALAYGGLRASVRATEKGQIILEDSSRIRMAHQFVRKQIDQMMPLVFAESEDGLERSIFMGSSDKIRFVAPMPGYLGFGGPQVLELGFVPGEEEGLDLYLWHAVLQDFEEQDLYENQPIFLVGRIDSAEFSFLGRDETGELLPWMFAWEDTSLLPEAVSLDIVFTEDVYIQWPLLTASVRVDQGALAMAGVNTGRNRRMRASVRGMPAPKEEK